MLECRVPHGPATGLDTAQHDLQFGLRERDRLGAAAHRALLRVHGDVGERHNQFRQHGRPAHQRAHPGDPVRSSRTAWSRTRRHGGDIGDCIVSN